MDQNIFHSIHFLKNRAKRGEYLALFRKIRKKLIFLQYLTIYLGYCVKTKKQNINLLPDVRMAMYALCIRIVKRTINALTFKYE